MRFWNVFAKNLREQLRDPWLLALILLFVPAFVVLFWFLFGGGSTTYGVLVLDQDVGVQTADGHFSAGQQLLTTLEAVTYADGRPMLRVMPVTDRTAAEVQLRDRQAAALLIIPPDFTSILQSAGTGGAPAAASVVFVGDLTNPYYAVAGVISSSALDVLVQGFVQQPRPIQIVEQPLGASAARSEFELYVPGLLAFAETMLLYSVPMAVAREREAGTLRRLQVTRMTSLDLLGGLSAAQVLLGVAAVALTFLAAWLLGFRSQGSLWLATGIAAVGSLSVVGMGLLVACFCRTVTEAFLVANVPLFLLMFLSGAMFPLPRVPLFAIAGRTILLTDILPLSHAVTAMNKVLTLGAGPGDLVYELTMLIVLSAIYYAVGMWLFQRMHLGK